MSIEWGFDLDVHLNALSVSLIKTGSAAFEENHAGDSTNFPSHSRHDVMRVNKIPLDGALFTTI